MTEFETTASNTTENEHRQSMIPMEVDETVQINCDSKGEVFRDEYNGSSEGRNENGSSSLLHRLPTAKINGMRSEPIQHAKCCFRQRRYIRPGNFALFVASILFAFVILAKRRKPVLQFRLDGDDSSAYYRSYSRSSSDMASANQTFKIMQITDIHLGEAEYTDWGPRQDEKTFALLDKIFAYEPDCDLLVLGGDQLTANNCLGNCTQYYEILGRYLSGQGIPWATIMGNHDDMDFEVEDGSGATIPHSYTRRDLLRVDQRFALSLSQASAERELTGVSNYVLDVLDPVTDRPALQIFFLDSGGGSLKEAINDDQVEWFRKEASATGNTAAVPAVAFQHIPTWQHEYVDGSCFGYRGDGVAELEYDGGIVGAMVESGRFHFLAVGHNHGNDYCCSYYGNDGNTNYNNRDIDVGDLYFCFGRHSGYGGYGKWDRGVRIYELSMKTSDNGGRFDSEKLFQWRTWVRLESGEKVDFMDYDHVMTENNNK
mmetsp:Transcript_24118/g.66862  ORF Transcript_24118/g.66862 Transcript_24118/m.66862 type:complete len:486 (-) Transcript_24118:242-1699(-)